MGMLINLRHLECLLRITELGSISKAAEIAHLSQSALTQGLSKIEAYLGTELFDRQSSGMFLTQAGELFMVRVSRALDHLKSFDEDQSANNQGRCQHRVYHRFSTAQLRCVIATDEHGSFSHAATLLNLSQPTVQRAVREVEANLDTSLFVRSATGVDATSMGKRLALSANLAFSEIEQGVDEVNEFLGNMTSRLVIGSLPLARTELVPKSATMLLQEFPNVQLSIVDGRYNELLGALLHSRIDMLLGGLCEPAPVPDVAQTSLFDTPLVVAVRADHPLANAPQLDAESLATLSWIAPHEGTSAERFRNIFLSRGLTPPVRTIKCSSSGAIRGLLLKTDRAALLSAQQIQPELKAKMLSILPIELNCSRTIGFTLRKGWKPTAVQSRYLELLKSLASSMEY